MSVGDGILELTRRRLRRIAEEHRLLDADVSVVARPLTPEEAIGTPGRRDYPILVGKERVVEAAVLGSKGHAFTDSPREFLGTVRDVLSLGATSNQDRAIVVATVNALLAHLGMLTGTVHCRDEDPEACALEMAHQLREKHGAVEVGLIGLNPAIAERLAETFGAEHLRISDLNPDNIGVRKFGVEIWDGRTRTEELIDRSDLVVFTGSTLVNGTFDRIWDRVRARDKRYVVYGVTAAGPCELLDLERFCPYGRDG